jgi:hypothetical protein
MKLTSAICILAVLLFSSVGALSAEKADAKATESRQAAKAAAKAKKAAAKKHRKNTEHVALTGSYIKQDIHRNGVVTDSVSPVVVLDSDAIQSSGAADLREVLVRKGLNH